MLDTVRQIETPEGVSLRLHAAGALPRAQAWIIDFGLRALILAVILGVLVQFGKAGVGIGLLCMFTAFWAYGVVCEVWFGGQTIGKRLIGLRVVNADGTPVTLLPSVLRNLLRVVDMLPGVYGVGLVSCLFDRHFRRIGDIVGGTMVVHVIATRRSGRMAAVGAEVPTQPLRLDEQEAVVAFAERASSLHVERQGELASLLEPLTACAGEASVRRLQAYANGFLGRT